MRSIIKFLALIFAVIVAFNCNAFAQTANAKHGENHKREQHKKEAHQSDEHGFGNASFARFHDLLHPLQHKAVPANDLKTLRAEAAALVRAGRPLTAMSAPRGTPDTKAFTAEQKKFSDALRAYEQAAAQGDDAAVKNSFAQVHDSFETLAQMLPR